ncbi:taurine--2-oxoglutarate transaminase [Halarchaeum solikamskense]|uniref:aminotransferase family protein n=1 Tax=Halarchaeum nitratireducens TaxID=489913 RepID=UPI001B3ACDD3|nr:aspartate aminotransferase family protein [Halarchaeum solikamskense]MBP2252408.1 taurine--2-oxoglutarate transaminase [Halarchaeum solikamskense]
MSHHSPNGDSLNVPHWYDPDSEILNIERGTDSYVWDTDGHAYLDFCSQLYCCNLGHSNDAVRRAMDEQVGTIPYVSSAKHAPVRDELASRLDDISPESVSYTSFAVSGSEANELAVQFARTHQDASTVLTRWRSYHGSTYGAGSLTGDPTTRTTLSEHAATTGAGKFLPPTPEAFDTDDPEALARRAADHLEYVIRNQGPDSVAAVLIEPVAGASGAYVGPADYFDRVRAVCDEYDVLLISDEVITGFGRCGEWFGIQTERVEPDMLTFAKGATGAYAPLAGVIAAPEIGEQIAEEGFDIGQTFAGHPVACAASLAAIDEYADGVIANVRENESVLADGLAAIADAHDAVRRIQGRGYHWGVEITDPETGEPYHDPLNDAGENPVHDVIAHARENGVLVAGGRPAHQILLSPPLIASATELERGLDALDDALGVVFDD